MSIFNRTPTNFTITVTKTVDKAKYAREIEASYANWPYRTGSLVEFIDLTGLDQTKLEQKQWTIKRGEIGIVTLGRIWIGDNTIVVAVMRDGDFYGLGVKPEQHVIPYVAP